MAVIADTIAYQWQGSTGSIDRDGPVEYLALWHLRCDTGLDQTQVIVIWWQLNMFGLGAPYIYANDAYGSLATCQNIRAVRKPETTDWWNVEVRFTRETDDSKRTVDDKPATIDPLEYRPIIRCSSNAVTKPASALYYLGGYRDRITNKIFGRPMVPVSSNLKPFDPPPDQDTYHWWISVEQNLEEFDGNKSYVGHTNALEFSIDYKGFTRGPIKSWQAKIRDCEVELTREHTRDFWRVRYYFEVLPDGEDFLHHLPDIGMDSLACDSTDPDLHGGVFGDDQNNTPVLEGRAKHVALIDAHGMPVRSPTLLDGDGHALDVCKEPFEPVVSTWDDNKSAIFANIPVIKEILAPG